ncbi:aminotransferase class I/II-fold pyridoxal phosphate-dependent enzyme [Clostridium sp. AF12-19]|nr:MULTISPECIES: aminotransferase class I/II-fold pyridoxal phosphate-dependent enzyme [unclassified Clostridium]RHS23526.1 aminotransferase class I/II-fold pyridoxal phosphate-dependent enzyme [Clostridium sp. AF12-28]RHS27152.1 aminotransferase class I/II-fold pyridoxal phosphate-dependent enzyme [Clostridium sp. AF12-19]
MKYNFDEQIDRRNTNALNTDGFRGYIFHAGPEKVFPYKDEEFIRMWVADMEFATAPAVCQAMKERIDRRIFGYTNVFGTDYYEALKKWCEDLYGWSFPQEELTFSSGIIPALYELAEDLLEKDETILITTPAYGFFQHTAEYNHVGLSCSPLKRVDGMFQIDFEDFERRAADPKTKLILWCNPHNPTGRMWTEEELAKVGEIAKKYDLWLISDEIHCDLIRHGKRHIPMGKVLPDYKKLITCMSASKTFNLAGLMLSNIIIRDPKLRETFTQKDKNVGFVNPVSLAAHTAAYQKGREWLEELKLYLDENFAFLDSFLKKYFPEAVYNIPEATYLAWIDMRNCLPGVENLPDFFANKAGVLLEGGDSLFVGNANGYIRLNLAMPRAMLECGLNRMKDAMEQYRKEGQEK